MKSEKIAQCAVIGACLIFCLAMISPTLERSREQIHRARCVSNLKRLWRGFSAYVQEHDGRLPMSGMCDRNLAEDWTWGGNIVAVPQTPASVTRIEIENGSIWPYVYGSFRTNDEEWYRDAVRNIYLCPTVGEVGRIRGLGYSMNVWLDGHQENPFLFGTLLADIPSPGATFLILEENELTLNDGCFIPGSFESGTDQTEVHAGGANHLFCDGHVQWLSRQALEEKMQSGEGFKWQE